MGVTEKHRHALFTDLERVLGPQHAATLMELLPPAGWADVATKQDLDAASASTRAETQALAADLRGEMQGLAADLRGETQALAADLRTEMRAQAADLRTEMRAQAAELRAQMVTKDDLRALHRDVATWIFAAMGVQTAVIGLLFGIVGG